MAIFTQHGEQVEIISGPMYDLLDPSTLAPMNQIVEVRSVADPSWMVRRRLFELKADGGIQEIQAAVDALATGSGAES